MSLFNDVRRRPPRIPALSLDGAVALEARGVTVSYDGTIVLRNIDLDIRSGEVLALVGPNGAGKSTLLGALAGDLPLDEGTVLVDGAPLEAWSPEELAIRRGVLLQQHHVAFPFSVTQIVRMGRAPWANTTAERWDDDVVLGALLETDTDRLANRSYPTLSGGERSRASLGRVLAQEPAVLLLDEPTGSLDIRHQEQVLNLVRGRAARGDGVVVVLHDLGLAAAYADVVAVLFDGSIVASGAPQQVFTPELLEDVYQHPIEVLRNPRDGSLVVLPLRGGDSG